MRSLYFAQSLYLTGTINNIVEIFVLWKMGQIFRLVLIVWRFL